MAAVLLLSSYPSQLAKCPEWRTFTLLVLPLSSLKEWGNEMNSQHNQSYPLLKVQNKVESNKVVLLSIANVSYLEASLCSAIFTSFCLFTNRSSSSISRFQRKRNEILVFIYKPFYLIKMLLIRFMLTEGFFILFSKKCR